MSLSLAAVLSLSLLSIFSSDRQLRSDNHLVVRCTLLLNELIDMLLSRISVICNLFVFKYRNSFFRLLAFHDLVLDELSFGIDDENLIFQYSN